MEDIAKHLEDPVVWGSGAGLVVLVLLFLALRMKGGKAKGRVFDDSLGRARNKLKSDVRSFRDDLTKAISAAGPVFRKVETESTQGEAVGHWRKEMKHRIQVKSIDLGTLKQMARTIGYDSMPLSELEAHWRKVERQVLEYNSGKLDNSRTPIASVKQIEKDLQSIVVLANMCLTKYSR